MKGLTDVKKELIASITQKELQLSKLKEHINKSEICSDLYNRVLIEKAVMKKQLADLQDDTIIKRIKNLIPNRKKKLICDYFN